MSDGDRVAMRACRNLLAGTDRVLAVVRPGSEELAALLQTEGAEVRVCADAEQGMGPAWVSVSIMPRGSGLADRPRGHALRRQYGCMWNRSCPSRSSGSWGMGALSRAFASLPAAWAEVVVNEPQATAERFPAAHHIINDDCRYQQLQPQPGDFVVIATHHKGDYDSLTRALQSEALYIALVSSRKRANLVLARLAKEGVPGSSLAKVRAPAGLGSRREAA